MIFEPYFEEKSVLKTVQDLYNAAEYEILPSL
jgi:hypothetical protein